MPDRHANLSREQKRHTKSFNLEWLLNNWREFEIRDLAFSQVGRDLRGLTIDLQVYPFAEHLIWEVEFAGKCEIFEQTP